MFGMIKLLWFAGITATELLSVDRNALKNVPAPTKYLAMVLLSCFWCLAFGIYASELYYIGYNMIGHVLLITAVFVTLSVFTSLTREYGARRNDWLRAPDRSSRCDEYTDEQRIELAKRLS